LPRWIKHRLSGKRRRLQSVGIEWVDRSEESARVWDVEPEVTPWQHIKSIVLGQFVPEEEI
jgi:hypothetical protein